MESSCARLILIRHAMPIIDPSRPASTWKLSDEGRSASEAMARELARFDIRAIVASEEPKAAETGAVIAGTLNIPLSTAPGLHEHERERVDWLGMEAWHAQIRRLFNYPDEMVFGLETANQALRRFRSAVQRVQASSLHREGALGIASHGTVMSLYLADLRNEDPYSIWKDLALPDYVAL